MPVRSTTGSANDFPAGASASSGVQNGGAMIHGGSNAAGIMTKTSASLTLLTNSMT